MGKKMEIAERTYGTTLKSEPAPSLCLYILRRDDNDKEYINSRELTCR